MAPKKEHTPYLRGALIEPRPVRGDMSAADVIDTAFMAYNGRRLREAAACSPKKCSNPTLSSG